MLRGVNRQEIFYTKDDRTRFLKTLFECKEVSGVKIYAYCLMSNHVHLLLKTGSEGLDIFMKRVGTRYAVWFNKKHGRVGHLFQDRFRSENVEDDVYFLTVLRYIIQNPMKAGLEKEPGHYPWSSYKAYARGNANLTDIELATSMAGGRENLILFLQMQNDDQALEMDDGRDEMDEDSAAREFWEISSCHSPAEFRRLPLERQHRVIREAAERGLSVEQICRLTGRSASTVYRFSKKGGF